MVTASNITRLTISLFWRLPPTSLPDAISTIPRTSTKSVASAPSAIRMKKKLLTPRGLRFLVQPANRQIAASEPCEQRRRVCARPAHRSEANTSELQSLMRLSYAVFCLNIKHNVGNTYILDDDADRQDNKQAPLQIHNVHNI